MLVALRADDVDLDRDRGLVRRFQGGDGEAFDELYRRYYDRLARFCQRRVRDHHTAEEIAQEAFARALTALPDLGGDRRFYPWVSVIAAHLCTDWHRRQGRSEPDPNPDPGPVSGGQDAIVDAVDVTLAIAALARLTPRHQDVLQLREIEGWSYRSIAEHYGVTIGTVETLLFRARHALRREFRLIEGGGLAAVPVLGWVLRHGPHFQRARWVRVHKLAAALHTPTTLVAAGASAGVVAVSLVLIPVAVPPPAPGVGPSASAAPLPVPSATGHGSRSGGAARHAVGRSTSTPVLAVGSAGVAASVASTFSTSSTAGETDTTGTTVVASGATGSIETTVASTLSTPSTSGALAASNPVVVTTTLPIDLALPAPSISGVTNGISSLGTAVGVSPVSIPPVTVPSAVGTTINGLATSAGDLLGFTTPTGGD